VLLLLGVPLFHLLGLLLVLLLDLLPSRVIGVLLRQPLVILLLFLLELLMILLLLLVQLVLLLLIFLILPGVPSVRRSRVLVRLNVLRVASVGRARNVVLRTRSCFIVPGLISAAIGWRIVRPSLFGRHAATKLSRPLSGRDRRLAAICGRS
jgi:hypothetical protein